MRELLSKKNAKRIRMIISGILFFYFLMMPLGVYIIDTGLTNIYRFQILDDMSAQISPMTETVLIFIEQIVDLFYGMAFGVALVGGFLFGRTITLVYLVITFIFLILFIKTAINYFQS